MNEEAKISPYQDRYTAKKCKTCKYWSAIRTEGWGSCALQGRVEAQGEHWSRYLSIGQHHTRDIFGCEAHEPIEVPT